MQVLLPKENIAFQESVEFFTREYLNKNKKINLKHLWQSLYKNSFISLKNTFLQDILVTKSCCKVMPGLGLFLLTQYTCIEIIKNHTNSNQKSKYLNKLISGENIACFALTERDAGSDISMIQTTAKKDNDKWVLNGHKIWASNGSISDLIISFAQTNSVRALRATPQQKDKSGITCFLIHSDSKDLEILKDTPKLGVKITPSNEIFIKNLKAEEDCQIGNIGDGIKIALSTITNGRIFCSSQALGLLEGILEESVKHSTKRNQFEKSISENQAIQWYIADMTKDLDAGTLLLYKACFAKENKKEELNKLSSMTKYFSTNVAQKHAGVAVQIHGGAGLNENSYVANAYKDAKVLEIYEGTNEIQKLVIARELKLS